MKTIRFMGSLLLIVATTLSFCACSTSKDEPAVEEEEDIVIPGKMPANIHVGMMYPISHDRKNNKCTYGLYLGENPSQELIDALEQEYVTVWMYDRYGKQYEYKLAGYNYDKDTGTYKDGFNTWNKEKMHGEFRHDNTLVIGCLACESVTKFKIHFDGPTIFEYYPELKDMEDVELFIGNSDGKLYGGFISQSWSSPHHFYK